MLFGFGLRPAFPMPNEFKHADPPSPCPNANLDRTHPDNKAHSYY
jgi:hypothetical protein